MKNTAVTFKESKLRNEKLTMLTAYDYSTAKIIDEAGINGILVGDSLGMVCLGHEDTLSVTMEDMIHHTRAVTRGAKNTLVVADMPFMSYQTGMATLFLTKIIRCCECCGVMAPIALDNEHPRI